MSKYLDEVRSDYIRYANCWEDADALLKGLQVKEGKKILSIACAGDNSFSLLSTCPNLVLAVDLNPAQLFLVELKKVAIAAMEREDYLAFAGFSSSTERIKNYNLLRSGLSSEAKTFWDSRLEGIESGLIYGGKFERYFKLFHKRILPLIHSSKKVNELFEIKTSQDQQAFYQKYWNTFLWRGLFKLFFSKRVMGKYGRDRAFLNEVEVAVGDFIFNQTEKHLSSSNCQQNYFLDFILRGRFSIGLPHYVRGENYSIVRENIHLLKLEKNYADAVGSSFGCFDYFNASNIFEYMPYPTFEMTSEKFASILNTDARILYWNLMVDRDLGEAIPKKFESDSNISANLTKEDKGFFYKKVLLTTRL